MHDRLCRLLACSGRERVPESAGAGHVDSWRQLSYMKLARAQT